MKPYLVLYATREGHTRRIAESMQESLAKRGRPAELVNAGELPEFFTLATYEGAFLAASVHVGKHEREMVDFVKRHARELEEMPAAFVSISLAEAGAEDPDATPEMRAKAAADVERMIDEFLAKTGWHPAKVKAVAGALLYTKYNFLLRFVMKRIARQAGGDTDTSRDFEYTDWRALDQFVEEMLADRGEPRGAAAP